MYSELLELYLELDKELENEEYFLKFPGQDIRGSLEKTFEKKPLPLQLLKGFCKKHINFLIDKETKYKTMNPHELPETVYRSEKNNCHKAL